MRRDLRLSAAAVLVAAAALVALCAAPGVHGLTQRQRSAVLDAPVYESGDVPQSSALAADEYVPPSALPPAATAEASDDSHSNSGSKMRFRGSSEASSTDGGAANPQHCVTEEGLRLIESFEADTEVHTRIRVYRRVFVAAHCISDLVSAVINPNQFSALVATASNTTVHTDPHIASCAFLMTNDCV